MTSMIYPVIVMNGAVIVQMPNGDQVHVTINREPATYPDGWHPRVVFAGFAPVYLMALTHDNGSTSTWFLDHHMERVAFDDPARLPPLYAAIVQQRGIQIFSAIWRQLLCATKPGLSADLRAFFQLSDVIRQRLCLFCAPHLNIKPFVFDLSLLQSRSVTLDLAEGVAARVDALNAILMDDLLQQSLAQLPEGALSWSSPFGQDRLRATQGLWLTDFMLVYRLVDSVANCIFYVVVSGHPCRVVAVFVPGAGIVFTIRNALNEYTNKIAGAPIEDLIISHLAKYGALVERSWNEPARSLGLVFRERLISGQIWHDLTGIDLVTRTVPHDKLPEIIGMWGLPEIYGRTEELFPETEGRVNRSLTTADSLARYAYLNGVCLLRTTASYVTRRLYTRIIATNLAQPSLALERARLRTIRDRKCPLVLLGLRVENRTVVDLPGFCVGLIEFMLSEAGQVAVVIDGHNSADTHTHGVEAVYNSEYQQFAKEQPIDVERRVVSELTAKFRDKNVMLIDNIGASMAHSLFWSSRSDFFVTFYGTGLAKYRWASNKTGLIVTSQWTLHHQGHLHIYEDEYLEDPSPLVFLPEEYVEDLPDAPLLISQPGDPPARWNFRVNMQGLFKEVRQFMRGEVR